jgi:hypothetical protein
LLHDDTKRSRAEKKSDRRLSTDTDLVEKKTIARAYVARPRNDTVRSEQLLLLLACT